LKIEWLKPFMHPRKLKAGARVFSKGDDAKEAFVLVEGRIVIPENAAAIEPGAIFGEMALFTATGWRTAFAVCASDVRLLVITYEQFEQLYFQNPEFGLYLVRLIVRRVEMNHAEPDGASVAAPFAI
jgi:CRP/FNR family cyclic AMP-dependent transcriptional regulator